jgi:hypothetical protein
MTFWNLPIPVELCILRVMGREGRGRRRRRERGGGWEREREIGGGGGDHGSGGKTPSKNNY